MTATLVAPAFLVVQDGGKDDPEINPSALLLPHERTAAADGSPPAATAPGAKRRRLDGGADVGRHSRQTSPADAAADGGAASAAEARGSCVWLSGVPVHVGEEALIEVFRQFGYPQKVRKLRLWHPCKSLASCFLAHTAF
jgi:hypothetical protein